MKNWIFILVLSVMTVGYVNAQKSTLQKQGTATQLVVDITALKDPASLGTERVKITGVSFDELTLADWEANKLGEESYPFTFADAEPIDLI